MQLTRAELFLGGVNDGTGGEISGVLRPCGETESGRLRKQEVEARLRGHCREVSMLTVDDFGCSNGAAAGELRVGEFLAILMTSTWLPAEGARAIVGNGFTPDPRWDERQMVHLYEQRVRFHVPFI